MPGADAVLSGPRAVRLHHRLPHRAARASPSGWRATSRCSRRCGSRTGRQVYRDVFQYWLRVFAVVFGMGVVSGVVMAYEFGTNWARFSDKAGPVIGPLMGYEVMTAFFLEAGFLGIMLFGRQRVGRGVLFRRHAAGGDRHADQRVLDPGGEFLDADAAGLHAARRTDASCRRTGGRSSSIRRSPIASCTW